MGAGYTISPLDSNESILEKLNKIEKYLQDNPLCNLFICTYNFNSNFDFYYQGDFKDWQTHTIQIGDLILFKNGVVSYVTAIGDAPTPRDIPIYFSTTNIVELYDGNTTIDSINVTNPTPTTAQIEITDSDGNTYTSNSFNVGGSDTDTTITAINVTAPVVDKRKIRLTDSNNQTLDSNEFYVGSTDSIEVQSVSTNTCKIVLKENGGTRTITSNVFSIGDTNTDTTISSVSVTESNNQATITITDSAGQTYTSNAFNVGGGGSESVFVHNHSITTTIASTPLSSAHDYYICIGDLAHADSQGAVALGTSAKAYDSNSIAIGTASNAQYGSNQIAIGFFADSRNDSLAIGEHTYACDKGIALGENAKIDSNMSSLTGSYAVQICNGTNYVQNSIQYKSHQLVSEENGTLKLSNELQLNNHLITIISTTNNFATASANGIQVSVDQNDSTHEQVQNLNHSTTDSSILNDEMVLAIYNYTDMTDPDNPVSEFTLCYSAFMNYDSVNNVCDCMLIQLAPSYTM